MHDVLKMMNMKQYSAVIAATIFMMHVGFAQQGVGVSKSGTTAATFLEISVGASAVGMGSAFVSIADDATALHWNLTIVTRNVADYSRSGIPVLNPWEPLRNQ